LYHYLEAAFSTKRDIAFYEQRRDTENLKTSAANAHQSRAPFSLGHKRCEKHSKPP